MGNKELAGNIQHEVNPIIGWLRLRIADGESLTSAEMESVVERLYRALENAEKIV